MFLILCIIGVLWVACSGLFILALAAAAAKKREHPEQRAAIVLEEAA